MGGPGLLVMGVLDSSFLFLPLGNDLLVIAMTANRHNFMPYFAAMATAGSVAGCFLLDLVFRKGGEQALDRHMHSKRFEYVRSCVEKQAGWAVAVASVMPPPFPFTPFVAASAALEYPRRKLLGVIAASRFVRFSIEGVLAIYFGHGILRLMRSPEVADAVIGLIIVSLAGSAFSVFRWIKRSRTAVAPRVRHAGSA